MRLKQSQVSGIIDRLKKALNPITIYLFGSQANKNTTENNSDVDLCIIVNDDDEACHKKAIKAYNCLKDMPFPKDIIVRHESRFKKKSLWLNSIEQEILETGKIIYHG